MNKNIKEICDTTVKNYRYAVQNLRYDGDYINHFSLTHTKKDNI